MRILQVINNLDTGGAEKLLLNTVPRYVALGVSIDVLVLNGTPHPFLKELRQYNGVKIHSLGLGSVYNPLHVFRILKYLRQYELLHVHLFPALYWVALAKFISFSKTPLIFTEHNTSNRRRSHIIFKVLDKWMYGQYRKIVTISSEVDSGIKTHLRFKPQRFAFIPNGVPLDEINATLPAIREEFGIPKEKKLLIQVSSFTPQKDQKTLIKALTHLDVNIILLLIGSGPLINECKALTANLQLEDRVHFMGICMDVPALLKMADIVVLSTYFEGLSLSSIEALASGNPFVASEAPGLAKIVEGAGIIFPIGDDHALAEKITELLDSDTLYSEVASRCLQRAQQFNIEKMIEKHLELYRDTLDKSKTI